MSQSTIAQVPAVAPGCDPATRITKSLLGYGVIAGPIYVVVALAQALTRHGFDIRRHAWSLLANGHLGWIQVTNFIVAGAMTIAFAVGLRRALDGGTGARWVPRLVGGYGLGLVAAGMFRADPALGFPPGTPGGVVTWHGALHFVAGGVGFLCLILACLAVARRERGGWRVFSALTGVLFLAGFAGVASGSHSAAVNLAFVAAVMLAWAWLSALAVRLYRGSAQPGIH